MVSFEKLLKILQDTAKTDYQKAADLHALLNDESEPAPKRTYTKRTRGSANGEAPTSEPSTPEA